MQLNPLFSSTRPIHEVKGIDVANMAIDRCETAQQLRLASLQLLTLKEIYILVGSIEDDQIAETIKLENRASLHTHFCSGTLDIFSEQMLTKAQSAASAYETDYFYTLHVASKVILYTDQYHAFVTAFTLFQADRSQNAQIVKKHLESITRQMKRSISQ